MSQERRILSLSNWIKLLEQDIDIQRRSKDGAFFMFCFIPYFLRNHSFLLHMCTNQKKICRFFLYSQ